MNMILESLSKLKLQTRIKKKKWNDCNLALGFSRLLKKSCHMTTLGIDFFSLFSLNLPISIVVKTLFLLISFAANIATHISEGRKRT